MLDAERRIALREVMDSLPLAARQRALAVETIDSMEPQEAKRALALFDALKAGLPLAQAAASRIRATGAEGTSATAQVASAEREADQPAPQGKASSMRRNLRKSVSKSLSERMQRFLDTLIGTTPVTLPLAYATAPDIGSIRMVAGKRMRVDPLVPRAWTLTKVAERMIAHKAVLPAGVLKIHGHNTGTQCDIVQYSGEVKGRLVEVYVRTSGKSRQSWKVEPNPSLVGLVLDGKVAYQGRGNATAERRISLESAQSEKEALEEFFDVAG